MTTLHDRLADLAEDAPLTSPPPDLWRHGKRLARRRRLAASAAAVAAVAGLAAGTGAVSTLVQTRQAVPADQAGTPALPDRIWTASSWLPHGSERGAGGPLAAVYEDLRTVWDDGSQRDLLGVSAVDQSYRWLDLPGFARAPDTYTGSTWSLAPDGSHVAYWTATDAGIRLVTVDMATGERFGYTVNGVDEASGLAWTGDRVWACRTRRCTDGAVRLDTATGQVSEVPGAAALAYGASYVAGADGTSTATWRHNTRTLVYRFGADGAGIDAPLTEVESSIGGLDTSIDSVSVSPDGTTLALTRAGQVRAGTVVPGGTTPTTEVGDGQYVLSLEGWVDDTHVVGRTEGWLVSIDVTTGQRQPLVELPEAIQPEVASGLLPTDTVPGQRPPTPRDPRYLAAGAAGAGLLAVGLVLVVRRRRAGR
jgi:hypothetical protein